MKRFLLAISSLFITAMLVAACGVSESTPDVPSTEVQAGEVPAAGPTMSPPTEIPAATDFYTEEFEGDISNYSTFEFHEKYLITETDPSLIPITKDGVLVFDLEKPQKYEYVIYEAYEYENTRLNLTAENRGENSNSVSLVCRYSDEGWYEANVQNDGLYSILAYVVSDGRYYTIFNGGSNLIKQGKDTNKYTFICSGDDLTLEINGIEVKIITDKKYHLPGGKVGFGVSSFDSLPILVAVDSFEISEP